MLSANIWLQIKINCFSYEAKTTTGKLSSDFTVNTEDSKKITGQMGRKTTRLSCKRLQEASAY